MILPSLVGLATSITLLAGVRSAAELAGAGLLFGTAPGFLYPVLNAFAIDQVMPAHLGRAQTSYNGAFNLGVTIGSLALGSVVQIQGRRAMFHYVAGAPVLALAIFLLGSRRALGGAVAEGVREVVS